jgi:hypothetical protein
LSRDNAKTDNGITVNSKLKKQRCLQPLSRTPLARL